MISMSTPPPLMVLGTSSGAGKSLMSAAICRVLLRQGESPLPFKGQNMSNNAWVDNHNGEMAYSQALQAWASGLEPMCEMNPVLLKPKGNCTSEVIHLGQSVGTTTARGYYREWVEPGWIAIKKGLEKLKQDYQQGRFVLEGAGSPVEVNLKHQDLTNLRLAKFLDARCVLVADIERGGVFAQIIGTLALMSQDEKELIRGLIINRFRGDITLFNDGRIWLEKETGIPVLGVMPWVNEIFPPEDSLDLIERKGGKPKAELKIAVIKLPSLSNFSDLDPLEAEPSVQLYWVEPGELLGEPDAVIVPGSKQTLRDLNLLQTSGLAQQIKTFAETGGTVLGICGGMQMIGRKLNDPHGLENSEVKNTSKQSLGLNLLPIDTLFEQKKSLRRREVISIWPNSTSLIGFELHHGISKKIEAFEGMMKPIFDDANLGWVLESKNQAQIAGTYLHGIFENGKWRRLWLNQLRLQKGLTALPIDEPHHSERRELLIDLLADIFEKHIDLEALLKP